MEARAENFNLSVFEIITNFWYSYFYEGLLTLFINTYGCACERTYDFEKRGYGGIRNERV